MAADVGNISTGQPVAPAKPAAPTAPTVPPKAPATGSTITIPEPSGRSGIGKKLLYGILALALLGALYWLASLFLTGNQGTEESPSPSPTISATLAPSRTLLSYFRTTGTAVELKDTVTARADFQNSLSTQQPTAQQALRIPVTGAAAQTFSDFLSNAGMAQVDPGIASVSGTDWAVLAYGQKEHFDANGQLIANSTVTNRLLVIAEVTDVSAANQAMSNWETTGMASTLAGLFAYDPLKAAVPTFSSGVYRQIPVRYQNFPYADVSLDWSILTASNNKSYLIIAGSREAAFLAIDQLLQ